jgi:hypothetical protein
MSKLKLPNIEDVVAIDIHTHAEEPCGKHGDDGYDDFQAQMANTSSHRTSIRQRFRKPQPIIYRAKKIARKLLNI